MSNATSTSCLISVIICTYNRCESLRGTLKSLETIFIPPDLVWELLVIDNNSSDKTSETVGSFLSRGTLPLKYVFEPVAGLSTARNRGVLESSGEILAFLDDDVVVSRQWLIEVRKAFAQYDAACVGGRVLLDDTSPRPPWWDRTYDVAVGEFDRGTQVIVDQSEETLIGIGANIIFKRTVFERCGWFRTDMGRKAGQLMTGEETDMVQRLRQQKQRLVYYPAALVYHCVPARRFSKPYLRQHFYNSGQWYFLKEWNDPSMGLRILGVPRWRYLSLLKSLWRMFLLLFRRRQTEFFFEQLQVAFYFGYFRAAHRAKRGLRLNPAQPRLEAPFTAVEKSKAEGKICESLGRQETLDDAM